MQQNKPTPRPAHMTNFKRQGLHVLSQAWVDSIEERLDPQACEQR